MANRMLKRTAGQFRGTFPAKAASAIQHGDLLWYDVTNSTLKTVGAAANLVETWTSEVAAVNKATERFVGVADFDWPSTSSYTKDFAVPTNAMFAIKYTGAAPKFGQLIGLKKDTGGNYLYRDTVSVVTDPRQAIGYCCANYSAAPTEVECMLFSCMDGQGGVRGRLGRITFGSWPRAACAAAGNLVLNYTFGERVKLLNLMSVETEPLTVADNVLTMKNGANSLDDTLTIAQATSALGTVTTQAIVDANDYDVFEMDDQFDLVTDGGSTEGEFFCILEFMRLWDCTLGV